jgi:hypothetical protein
LWFSEVPDLLLLFIHWALLTLSHRNVTFE